jgi:hypothetical protein|tara:strand:+ start:917 stop:1051 length:135 start_codon:yes stop_codon:yes gene_type:complete
VKEVLIITLCFILTVIVAKQVRKVQTEPVELFTDQEIEEWKPFD